MGEGFPNTDNFQNELVGRPTSGMEIKNSISWFSYDMKIRNNLRFTTTNYHFMTNAQRLATEYVTAWELLQFLLFFRG